MKKNYLESEPSYYLSLVSSISNKKNTPLFYEMFDKYG